jgi:NAD(P)H dehydrogenase (quinone)
VTKTVLIVHAHPDSDSFSAAQSSAAAQALRAVGHTVDTIDLYDDVWQPVLRRQDFPEVHGAFKPQAEQMRSVADGTVDPVVREHLDRLLAADLLVLSFPMWWFSVPAILKGLGVEEPIKIADDEYDRLFVVTLGLAGPRLLSLRYGP